MYNTFDIDFTGYILRYPEIASMLLGNTSGKIWMIGGAVAKIILHKIGHSDYHPPFDPFNLYTLGDFPARDFDFIVEEIDNDFMVTRDWKKSVNTFGGIKLTKQSLFADPKAVVDIWRLCDHDACRRNGAAHTIGNVLKLAPLSIQSIAVDLEEGKIMGRVGIDSIKSKTVRVNNKEEFLYYCKVYNKNPKYFIKQKALEYGFTPIYDY